MYKRKSDQNQGSKNGPELKENTSEAPSTSNLSLNTKLEEELKQEKDEKPEQGEDEMEELAKLLLDDDEFIEEPDQDKEKIKLLMEDDEFIEYPEVEVTEKLLDEIGASEPIEHQWDEGAPISKDWQTVQYWEELYRQQQKAQKENKVEEKEPKESE